MSGAVLRSFESILRTLKFDQSNFLGSFNTLLGLTSLKLNT